MFIEDAVLATVHLLLADEPLDVLLELGILDPVPHPLDRAHEEILTVGEHRRERHEHVAEDDVAVGGEVLGHVLHPLIELHRAGRHRAHECERQQTTHGAPVCRTPAACADAPPGGITERLGRPTGRGFVAALRGVVYAA